MQLTKLTKFLKKLGLRKFSLVRQYLRESRNNLCVILFGLFCIEAFVLYNTYFYEISHYVLDKIDTVLYVIIWLDFCKDVYKSIKYNIPIQYKYSKLITFVCLIAILLVNVAYYLFDIKDEDYYMIYSGILKGGLIFFYAIKLDKE